uniref:Uncharacterized protein n=1 Tax=Periophthalmus magnuspinnatus TaxID=409849 RepID=A0A3B3ZHW2_9GOBI
CQPRVEVSVEASVEGLLDLVMQKDFGTRTQTGLEIIDRILDSEKSPGLEQDQSAMDRIVDTVVCSWVNDNNFKVKS